MWYCQSAHPGKVGIGRQVSLLFCIRWHLLADVDFGPDHPSFLGVKPVWCDWVVLLTSQGLLISDNIFGVLASCRVTISTSSVRNVNGRELVQLSLKCRKTEHLCLNTPDVATFVFQKFRYNVMLFFCWKMLGFCLEC